MSHDPVRATRRTRPEKVPSQAVALGLEQDLYQAVAARYESAQQRKATTARCSGGPQNSAWTS